MDIELTGKLHKCPNCALSKIRKKNINKEVEKKETVPGRKLHIDISGIKYHSSGGSKFWLLVVDKATDCKFSFFLKKKSEMTEVMVPFLKELRDTYKRTVEIMQCDNAGENKVLEQACTEANLGIKFKYTAPGTPQQNGIVEQAFPTRMVKQEQCLIKLDLIKL